jgi:hypothetical protein
MEKEIIEEREIVYPLGDFNSQKYPRIEGMAYAISEEEKIKLGKHLLKWSTETYEAEEDVFEETEVDGEIVKTKIGTKTITKTRPILIPNDPTEENTRNLAVQRIAELKKYLSDTDYIVTKIAEAETEEEKTELREEYAPKLVLRKKWRSDINELERYLYEENRAD